jgi:hypothetical protein
MNSSAFPIRRKTCSRRSGWALIDHYLTLDDINLYESAKADPQVKATATAHPDDFKHIRGLQAELGDSFDKGLLLYRGERFLTRASSCSPCLLGFWHESGRRVPVRSLLRGIPGKACWNKYRCHSTLGSA